MAASTDVTPIAALAKLAISDQSYSQVKENFESTLKLFDELTQVDTAGMAPLVSPGDRHQICGQTPTRPSWSGMN